MRLVSTLLLIALVWVPSLSHAQESAPFTFDFQRTNLRDAIRQVARKARYNLVLHPKVDGVVSVRLRSINFEESMSTILKGTGLGHRVLVSGVLVVAPPEALSQIPDDPIQTYWWNTENPRCTGEHQNSNN